MTNKFSRVLFITSVMSVFAYGAEPGSVNDSPPAQCMSQCELAGACDEIAFDDYPDYDDTVLELSANCAASHLYAIEGACSDGRKLLGTGTGFTNEIRLYTATGQFESLITQTDVVSQPCMGQSYWPLYKQCDAPTVTGTICGPELETGSSAFQNRWEQ